MSLIDRTKNIIMTPKTEWEVIANEEPNATAIMTGFVIPFTLLDAAATFVGYGVIGLAGFHSIKWGIGMAVMHLIVGIVGTYLSAMIVDALAPSFGSEKNLGRSMQLVAYSRAPGFVASLFYALPFLGWFVWIGSLYGYYLMYLGLPAIKKTPQDKTVSYLVVSIIVQVVIIGVSMAILTGIVFSMLVGTSMLGY